MGELEPRIISRTLSETYGEDYLKTKCKWAEEIRFIKQPGAKHVLEWVAKKDSYIAILSSRITFASNHIYFNAPIIIEGQEVDRIIKEHKHPGVKFMQLVDKKIDQALWHMDKWYEAKMHEE